MHTCESLGSNSVWLKCVPQVQIEESRFTREDGLWLFTDYKLVEVPEALAKTAELQAKDMAAAAAPSPLPPAA
jgi:hypothetical protein